MGILKSEVKDNSPSWVRYVKSRIKRKLNWLVLISGPTGSGKSFASLSLALQLDPKFGPDRIVFSLRGLMDLINGAEKFPAGSVFVFEEAQIDVGNRNWQSLTNKLLNSLLSTFRHKSFVVIFNAPYSDFLDSQTKKLLHAEFSTVRIDYEQNKTIIKPMVVQYNSRSRTFYFKYLRVRAKFGLSAVKLWGVTKPPQWLIDIYETKKTEFTSSLNKDISKQLDKLEQKEGIDTDTRKKPTKKQQQVYDLMVKHNDVAVVALETGLSHSTVYFHLQQLAKKNYIVGEETEKGAIL